MRLFVGVVMVLVSLPACAIVNIEDLQLDENVQGGSGSLSLNFSGKSGNSDNLQGSVSLGLQFVRGHQVELMLASYDYSASNGVGNDENKFLHLRHTSWITSNSAWELYTQYERSPYIANKKRFIVGAGGRWKRQAQAFKGVFAASIFYEDEQADEVEPNGLKEYEKSKIYRFNWMLEGSYDLSKQTKMGISVYFQPKVNEWENNRTIANWNLTNQLIGNLATTMTINYKHDSKPYLNLKEDDWQYEMGVNYKF